MRQVRLCHRGSAHQVRVEIRHVGIRHVGERSVGEHGKQPLAVAVPSMSKRSPEVVRAPLTDTVPGVWCDVGRPESPKRSIQAEATSERRWIVLAGVTAGTIRRSEKVFAARKDDLSAAYS